MQSFYQDITSSPAKKKERILKSFQKTSYYLKKFTAKLQMSTFEDLTEKKKQYFYKKQSIN
ncbi:hypothetical protein BpHYR1_019106 [Brachionus plicatilis]|uniref:Uncharacterized protein n=1 Tax=Brachionus plicatilis TaxID=10195 RepID=A0A3M7SCX7_BRAPC|nr:hypothetical protein BpHYR1_019106 [Brachionus plicatilis]